MAYSFRRFLGRALMTQGTGVLSVMDTTSIPPIVSPLMAAILPGPSPRTVTRTVFIPIPIPLVASVMAVAWAAMFVPSLVFLNPSLPQLWTVLTIPLPSQREMMVLFGDDFILQMGRSAYLIPLKSLLGVFTSGKSPVCLWWKNYWSYETSTRFSPNVPSSSFGIAATICFRERSSRFK